MGNSNIKFANKLNDNEIGEIYKLIELCNTTDRLDLNINLEDREFINDLLYYEKDNLVGYLTLLTSYKFKEMQAIGIVHPMFRRNGIFTEITDKAIDICKGKNIEKLIFINSNSSNSGVEFLNSIGASYRSSSYKMVYKIDSNKTKNITKKRIDINIANIEDIDDLINIGSEAFGTTIQEEKEYIMSGLIKPNKTIFIARSNMKSIGAVSISKVNEEIIISDLAVTKSNRGMGMGRTILKSIVERLLEENNNRITLFVEVKNKGAISLYEDIGFVVSNGNDFYELSIPG